MEDTVHKLFNVSTQTIEAKPIVTQTIPSTFEALVEAKSSLYMFGAIGDVYMETTT